MLKKDRHVQVIIETQIDQRELLALWNDINTLTIHVSQLKEKFVRLIDPPSKLNGDTPSSIEIIRPAKKW